jgi:hypothetical protein
MEDILTDKEGNYKSFLRLIGFHLNTVGNHLA